MPVEIRELIIRATVSQEGQGGASASPATTGRASPNEEIIKLCVEKVMDILKEKNER